MIDVKKLQVCFTKPDGKKVKVLDNINLFIEKGEFVTIFGPNGCGKSTLANIISGVENYSGGEVTFYKSPVEISYMFQDYRPTLLPWKNVQYNIAVPLLWRGIKWKNAGQKTSQIIKNFNISIDLKAYPFMLSGGQAQLVCILRSLIIEPDILILDEPFSALDYLNHINLMLKLQEIWNAFKPTTLFVSHDIEEAIFFGDKIIILSPRPAKIVEIIEMPIPKPRSVDIFTHPEFVKIKEKALKVINPS